MPRCPSRELPGQGRRHSPAPGAPRLRAETVPAPGAPVPTGRRRRPHGAPGLADEAPGTPVHSDTARTPRPRCGWPGRIHNPLPSQPPNGWGGDPGPLERCSLMAEGKPCSDGPQSEGGDRGAASRSAGEAAAGTAAPSSVWPEQNTERSTERRKAKPAARALPRGREDSTPEGPREGPGEGV